jgi:DUF2075 family protein/predicted GIY-YIG superfamily endonuclease
MTNSDIESVRFDNIALSNWATENPRRKNWPVVYTINNETEIYVGETTNAELRMKQHLVSPTKQHLKTVNVIIDDSFNKSVCLDLESHLIKYFHADEKYLVLNGNGGITDSDYFKRSEYRKAFEEIFEKLIASGQLTRTIPELVNSDLFKYSPFKALTTDQAIAVETILELLLDSEVSGQPSRPIVVQGDPGTGKTIVAVYLMKLLSDIARSGGEESLDTDSLFSDFFRPGYREQLERMTIALVVPQISLRKTLKRVFSRTPGLDESMVLEPFEVGEAGTIYDLLIVDEAHRLQQRNNQPAAQRNKQFRAINEKVFGADDSKYTQFDWILARSRHQIFLLDQAQSVKPADLPKPIVDQLVTNAKAGHSFLALTSQMRVEGGEDYIEYVGRVLNGTYSGPAKSFGNYEVKLFERFDQMRSELLKREEEVGLSRVVSGFAWPWVSRFGEDHDFVLDGVSLVWNRRPYDWINSKTSLDEVGSIHTVQGYDLNYAAVVIGPDLGFDPVTQKIVFHRANYHDKKGKENNKVLGRRYTDEDLLTFVVNIYRVLLTRGVKGTYIYVVDLELRQFLARFFQRNENS